LRRYGCDMPLPIYRYLKIRNRVIEDRPGEQAWEV